MTEGEDRIGTDFYQDFEYEPYGGHCHFNGYFFAAFFTEAAENIFVSALDGGTFPAALSGFFFIGIVAARRLADAPGTAGPDGLYSAEYRSDGTAGGGSSGFGSRNFRECASSAGNTGNFS